MTLGSAISAPRAAESAGSKAISRHGPLRWAPSAPSQVSRARISCVPPAAEPPNAKRTMTCRSSPASRSPSAIDHCVAAVCAWPVRADQLGVDPRAGVDLQRHVAARLRRTARRARPGTCARSPRGCAGCGTGRHPRPPAAPAGFRHSRRRCRTCSCPRAHARGRRRPRKRSAPDRSARRWPVRRSAGSSAPVSRRPRWGAMARQPVSQPSCSAVLPRAWTAPSSARRRALTSRVAGAPACSTSMCSSKITAATRSVSSSCSSTASAARRAVSIFAPLMEPLRSSTSPIASGGRAGPRSATG